MRTWIVEITNKLRINYKAREWCKLPYPNHPKGCPKYGTRADCPPQAPLIEKYIDVSERMWFAITEFDLGAHERRMKSLHPHWTERQARCVLYWQKSVDKELERFTRKYVCENPGSIYTLSPEAMGVNVIATAKQVGIPIKVHPRETVYKISVIGYPKTC